MGLPEVNNNNNNNNNSNSNSNNKNNNNNNNSNTNNSNSNNTNNNNNSNSNNKNNNNSNNNSSNSNNKNNNNNSNNNSSLPEAAEARGLALRGRQQPRVPGANSEENEKQPKKRKTIKTYLLNPLLEMPDPRWAASLRFFCVYY